MKEVNRKRGNTREGRERERERERERGEGVKYTVRHTLKKLNRR